MNGKNLFAQEIKTMAQKFLEVKNDCSKLHSAYFSNGYNSGGYNEIQDADVEEDNVTAADLENSVTMLQEFQNFIGNQAVVTGDYQSTITRVLF